MIPEWKLERYRLGELGAADRAEIDRALDGDAALRTRLTALEASDRDVRAQYPSLPARSRPAPAARETQWLWRVPVLAAVAAAALVLVFLPRPGQDDVLTPKGPGATLRLFRQAAEPERLADGSHVKPHDVVQVAFDLQGAQHLVVASVDGAGQATLHWPKGGSTAVPPGFKALPDSFELDEAPGFERFFLIASNQALSPEAVLAAVRDAGRTKEPSFGNTVTVRSLLLQKDTP